MWDTPLYTIASFLIGACIGSFLNVVIYRVPLGLSVNTPKRSFCPSCKTPIEGYNNIPLFSWLLLRGKCAHCKTGISIRYWLIELLTAVLFASLWILYPHPGTLLLFGWCALAIVITFIDAEHMLVYPLQTIAGAGLALAAVTVNPALLQSTSRFDAAINSVLGACAGFLLLYIVLQVGKLIFGKQVHKFDEETSWHLRDPKTETEELTLVIGEEEIEWSFLFGRPSDRLILKDATLRIDNGEPVPGEIILTESTIQAGGQSFSLEAAASVCGTARQAIIPREAMGSGDPYIMGMICALTGWQSIPLILLAASLTGVITAIIQRMGFGARIPFGPMLFIGAFFWIFYGHSLWERYLLIFY